MVAESAHGKVFGADSSFKTVFDNSIIELTGHEDFTIFNENNAIQIQLNNPSESKMLILVFNLMGKVILSDNIISTGIIHLPEKGAVYLVQVLFGEKIVTKMIITQ
jgi:hypothetical protein